MLKIEKKSKAREEVKNEFSRELGPDFWLPLLWAKPV
jgi:hypothetical protein